MNKKIIYVDMDDTLFDYKKHYIKQKNETGLEYPQSRPNFYIDLPLKEDAKEVFNWLCSKNIFDVYILTAPSFKNKHSYSEKAIQIEKNFGYEMLKRLIISPNKGLSRGDYLIDDYDTGKGQEFFKGKLIKYGVKPFEDWKKIKKYFQEKYHLES